MPGRGTLPNTPGSSGDVDLTDPTTPSTDEWQPDPRRVLGIIRWVPANMGHRGLGRQYSTTVIGRSFSISATALLNKLPLVYAEPGNPIRLQGLLSFTHDYSPKRFLGVIASFAHGPLESLGGFEINGIPIGDCSFVRNYASSVGGFSKTAYPFFVDSLSAFNFEETYPGIADLGILMQTDDPNMPGSLSITALCGGRTVTDYRTAAIGASANPAICTYDVLTLPEIGCGIDPALVDTGVGSSWRQKADWHDEVMSDGTKRYHFVGAMTQDPWLIIEEISKHGFVEIDSDGSKYTLFGWDNPDTVVEAFDVGIDDVKEPLRWREIPEQRRPNALNVNYKVGETGEPAYVPTEVPGIDAVTIRPQSVSYSGCRSRSVGKRIGTKLVNIALQERHEWNGDVRAESVAGAIRGSIGRLTTHDGIANDMLVRILDKGEPLNGWVDCTFCEYGATTDSEEVSDEIGVVPTSPPGPPPVPTTYTEEILHIGPWQANSLVGSDGDDLVTSSWSTANASIVYNGTEEATIFEVTPASSSGSVFYDGIVIPAEAEAIKLTLSLEFFDHVDYEGFELSVRLQNGGAGTVWERIVTPPDDRYVTAAWIVRLSKLAATPTRIRIRVERPTGLTDEPEIAIKRVFMVPSGSSIVDSDQYRIVGRHEWTQPSDPTELIRGYQAVKRTSSGVVVSASLDKEEDDYDYPLFFKDFQQTDSNPQGSSSLGDSVTADTVNIVSPFIIILQSVGLSLVSSFPAPTQTFTEQVEAPPELSIGEHKYRMSDLLEEPIDGRAAENWTQGLGVLTITPNVATAPDGTLTGDRVQLQAAWTSGYVYDNNQWPGSEIKGTFYNRTVWMQKSTGTYPVDDVLIKDPDNPSANLNTVSRLKDYWRMYHTQALTNPLGGYPINGGPIVQISGSRNEVEVWSAGYQPIDSGGFEFDLTINWTQPDTPWLIDHMRFQYRFADSTVWPTVTLRDWEFWGDEIPLANGQVIIGTSTRAQVPWFPLFDETTTTDRLNDWRLVAVGVDGQITEVSDPADVSVEVLPRDFAVLKSTDFDHSAKTGDAVLVTASDGFTGTYKPLSEFATSDGPVIQDEVTVTIDASHVLNLPAEGSNFRVLNYAAASSDYIDDITGGVTGRTVRLRAGNSAQAFILYNRDTVGTSTVVMESPVNFLTLRESVTLQYNSEGRWVIVSDGNLIHWDDMRITTFRPVGGGTYPPLTQYANDGAGSTGIDVEEFPSNLVRTLQGRTQLSHEYHRGSDIYPHFHFTPTTSQTGTFVAVCVLEYIIVPVGATKGNTTLVTQNISLVNPVAGKHYIGAFPVISGSGIKESSMAHLRFERTGNAPADNMGNFWFHEMDLHIEKNKLGTYIAVVP